MLALLLAALPLRAFVLDGDGNGVPEKWNLALPSTLHTNLFNPNTKALRYFIAADAYSTTNTANELNAVRASFAQWQAVPGTGIKFEDGGLLAPGVYLDLNDNTNAVSWAKTSTLISPGNDVNGTLGVTFISYIGDDIVNADIVFNGVEFTWFTDFNATNVPGVNYLESVAVHEIGHLLGFQHSPVGGATMFFQGVAGEVNAQAGLNSDDTSAVRAVYPQTNSPVGLAALKGQVLKNGLPVYGATVVVEGSPSGVILAGTVTLTNGTYELPALPSGATKVRVTPLDPDGSALSLVQGVYVNYLFDTADTSFLPTANSNVTLNVGTTNTLNFTVVNGTPPLRITSIRAPKTGSITRRNTTALTTVGQSNLVVGVYSPNVATNDGSVLTITGDGLTISGTSFQVDPFSPGSPQQNLLNVTLSIASNAPPGLRSFVVTRGGDVAYANGFLEILPPAPDFNFDGVDDRFQRQYFPLFTAPIAGPASDPDGDGFPNFAESVAATNPTNSLSLLKITSVSQNVSGTTIAWQSVNGKKYQVVSRPNLPGSVWQTNLPPVTATNATAQVVDPTPGPMRFYRVQVLP